MADLTPSTNVQNFLAAADIAAMQTALIDSPQIVAAGHGAVDDADLTKLTTTYENDGTADTTSNLTAGADGQSKELVCIGVSGFNVVITVTNSSWGGAGTITFDTAYENVTLKYLNAKWMPMVNNGAVLA